jgi:pyruvate formate lyase activating enzyme
MLAAQGWTVKLDTNGAFPEAIARLLAGNLVQYVSVDVKASPARYEVACGGAADVAAIRETVLFLRRSGTQHELRTTVLPRLHDVEEMRAIGDWLGGDSPYFLQPFRPGRTLNPAWAHEEVPSAEFLEELVAVAANYFPRVAVRL